MERRGGLQMHRGILIALIAIVVLGAGIIWYHETTEGPIGYTYPTYDDSSWSSSLSSYFPTREEALHHCSNPRLVGGNATTAAMYSCDVEASPRAGPTH